MSSSIELINPKAESVRRAAALQVKIMIWCSRIILFLTWCVQVNTTGAMGLANVVKISFSNSIQASRVAC